MLVFERKLTLLYLQKTAGDFWDNSGVSLKVHGPMVHSLEQTLNLNTLGVAGTYFEHTRRNTASLNSV